MKIAPDIYNPIVHDHTDQSPQMIAIYARCMYRTRRLAAKLKPRDHAKNYIRSELGRGVELQSIMEMDGASSCAYFKVECGPICARLPHGKIRAWVYGHGAEIFQVKELYDEVLLEKRQNKLF